ncbi:MAG TPA: sulfotransferase domain-containing protein [Thermohalobaculum sp.]|nr:sulfotransferase domain-containing protein [Thermohalobaculum sp.]
MNALNRIIWIASFPKSGNTWTRIFLANYFLPKEQVPDINNLRKFTLSDMRQDFFDRAAGRKFEAADFDEWLTMRVKALRLIAAAKPNPHFVKTHCQIMRVGPIDVIPPELTAAAIYVLRNPFDVVPSYARHMDSDLDTAIDRMLDAKHLNGIGSGIMETVGRWDDHIRRWTEAPGLPRHVMRYEDMVADPERSFRGLLGFLRAPVQDGRLRRAVRASSFEKLKSAEEKKGFIERPKNMKAFFAKGKAGAWREDLTPAQVARLVEGFRPTLQQWYPDVLAEAETMAGSAA